MQSTIRQTMSRKALCGLLILALALSLFACDKKPAKQTAIEEDDVVLSFAQQIKKIRQAQKWSKRTKALTGDYPKQAIADAQPYLKLQMNLDLLEKTFALGSDFLYNWQLPEGNFRYMYDWLEKTWAKGDNQVRQAGSLWGVALCYQYKPTAKGKKVLDKGLKFWFDNTIPGPDDSLTLKYKNDRSIMSGTVALVGLTIIEYLITDTNMDEEYKKELTEKLDGYLRFLQWMQRSNGHIAKEYYLDKDRQSNRSSPYFDGESLLCLCKAARLLNYKNLVPTIEKAARAMAETYTVKAWAKEKDSKQTKGFYQWGSMSFVEYYQAKWKDYELYGDVTLALSWWMTHVHHTLRMGRNHAYAIEGLISAYRIAKMRQDTAAMIDLFYTIDRSLYKLTAWQVGGPLAANNKFLQNNPTKDPLAIGGVMNSRHKGRPRPGDVQQELRIDVTQHQMHSVSLALENVYSPAEQATAE